MHINCIRHTKSEADLYLHNHKYLKPVYAYKITFVNCVCDYFVVEILVLNVAIESIKHTNCFYFGIFMIIDNII